MKPASHLSFIAILMSLPIFLLVTLTINTQPSYAHTELKTAVNFLEYIIKGGPQNKYELYTYSDVNHTLLHKDLIDNTKSMSKTLNETDIDQLNDVFNQSNVLNSQVYDPVCSNCYLYRLSYIYTDIEKFDLFSGVGIWHPGSKNSNSVNFAKVGDTIVKIMNNGTSK